MPPVEQERGQAYWRSLEELAATPEFQERLEREFPAGASELAASDRRDFLKLMGASLALAGIGLSGCRRWPEEQIAPFAHRPAGMTPGLPEYYATAMEIGGVATGLLATSFDGRPIKVEGNPQHPISAGSSDHLVQASILDLYDPYRSRAVLQVKDAARLRKSWSDFETWAQGHFDGIADDKGAGLAVLCEQSSSPSLEQMRQRFMARFPRAAWHVWEPLNNDNELAGSMAAFGSAQRPQHDLTQAKIIVSLDADFLHTHPGAVKHARDFAATRHADDGEMSRLYVFESGLSLTGANADHRLAVRGTDVAAVAGLLARRLLPDVRPSSNTAQRRFDDLDPTELGLDPKAFGQLVADLRAHPGQSLLLAGARQPAEVHVLVHALNEVLGNVGRSVTYTPALDAMAHLESITALVGAITDGRVSTLVILGGNPVYDAPADLEFPKHLAGITTIHLSHIDNETSRLSAWHLPRAHYLESWGDARAWDGTLTLTQPLIEPLFGGRTPQELLALLTADKLTKGHDLTRRALGGILGRRDFEAKWREALHNGFVGPAARRGTPRVRRGELSQAVNDLWERWQPAEPDRFELAFAADPKIYDGRFTTNGWLQELPDPLTKLTWDNAVQMGPAAARRLGVQTGDLVRLTHGPHSLEAAVLEVPGHHPESVTLTLGWGRLGEISPIADGAGFDFYRLRTATAMGFGTGATIEKARGSYKLVSTQDHHAIGEVGRKGIQKRLPTLFREANLQEYRTDPKFAAQRLHVVHRLSLWNESLMAGAEYKWAMAIDLTACTGCSACVVACQAENNIPIVGKDQINRGRELHWIRIDRYFKGTDPQWPEAVAMQPVPCMMCENAPCEQVCPVAATTHDVDGLNVMVYNRCIGTRYCSNNCPYKVRRFNYFDYQTRQPMRSTGALHVKPSYWTRPQSDTDPLKRLQHNPEVTVRSRGVMEKCTYCVQRLTKAKIKAKNEWVRSDPQQRPQRVNVPDRDIVPACAQACPTQAIFLGDLNNPDSGIRPRHGHPRAYEMLEELNNKPRTKYLAKLRNPAPGLGAHGEPADGAPATETHG